METLRTPLTSSHGLRGERSANGEGLTSAISRGTTYVRVSAHKQTNDGTKRTLKISRHAPRDWLEMQRGEEHLTLRRDGGGPLEPLRPRRRRLPGQQRIVATARGRRAHGRFRRIRPAKAISFALQVLALQSCPINRRRFRCCAAVMWRRAGDGPRRRWRWRRTAVVYDRSLFPLTADATQKKHLDAITAVLTARFSAPGRIIPQHCRARAEDRARSGRAATALQHLSPRVTSGRASSVCD